MLSQYQSNRSKGLCGYCTLPAERGALCARHRAQNAARRRTTVARAIAAGLCVCCLENPTRGTRYCETCLLKRLAVRTFGKGGRWRWKELKDLLVSQEGRCALTGDPIFVEGTVPLDERNILSRASIDHKVPKSRGGSDDLSNLRWVSWAAANSAKSDLSEEDFVELCRKVLLRKDFTVQPIVQPAGY